VATYRQYLDASPEASTRDVVEARLAEIAAASARASAPTAPTGPIFTPVTTTATATATTSTAATTTTGYVTHAMATEDHWEQQGPEWVASWVMLALTAGTSVAAVLVWQDGLARFQELQDLCGSMDGCTRSDIEQSSAHTSQDATNALLGVSIGLGAITLLTFVVEGVVTGNRMRFVRGGARRESHEPHFAIGPLGFSVSGTF
jgi:hypothetical protein